MEADLPEFLPRYRGHWITSRAVVLLMRARKPSLLEIVVNYIERKINAINYIRGRRAQELRPNSEGGDVPFRG
jgi:hypothetical protein